MDIIKCGSLDFEQTKSANFSFSKQQLTRLYLFIARTFLPAKTLNFTAFNHGLTENQARFRQADNQTENKTDKKERPANII